MLSAIKANLSPEWIKKLENASARFHISRLESIQLQIHQQVELLYGNQLDSLDALLRKVTGEGYTRTAFEIQKGVGYGWDISALNQRKLEPLLSKPWTADNKTFRDRCWEGKAGLVSGIQIRLTQALLRGDSLQRLTDDIKHQFRVSRYKAGRLAHTETTYFNAVATREVYRDLDVKEVEIIETLDKFTCDLCGPLDGTKIPMAQYEPGVTVPLFHPNCRGTTAPAIDESIVSQRAARDEAGEVYYVPSNMTYKAWKAAFVDGGAKDGLTLAKMGGILGILTNNETWAINEYISSGSYRINAALREGLPLSEEQTELIQALDSALEKMPIYQRTVHRSLDTRMMADVDSFWKQHIVDMPIEYPAYTSAGTTIYDETFAIQYIIESKTGRDLRKYNSREMEVLFPRGTKFRITRISEGNIYMEEYSG